MRKVWATYVFLSLLSSCLLPEGSLDLKVGLVTVKFQAFNLTKEVSQESHGDLDLNFPKNFVTMLIKFWLKLQLTR